jgi:hypothetical protein
LFTTKGNLVVMSKLYHKIAVAFACTALSFTLVANKEAQAATFNLTPTTKFAIQKTLAPSPPGSSDPVLSEEIEYGGGVSTTIFFVQRYPPRYSYVARDEARQFYEFPIGSLAFDTNTIITRAILHIPLDNVTSNSGYMDLDLYGYVGNGRPDIDDFNAGGFLGSQDALYRYPFHQAEFDVTNFVSQRVSNGNGFAGFGVRAYIGLFLQPGVSQETGSAIFSYGNNQPTLIIETVPEPTTIFGSALALAVAGWLKQKKSSRQNKTMS